MTAVTTANEVLLYVPNVIGYTRVLGAFSSFVLMVCRPDLWVLAITLYLGNFVGDLVDGWVARKLNQCSSFGGVLDMITDRCSTAGLLYVLSGELSEKDAALPVPFYRLSFLTLMLLDISSHWVQMHSTLAIGEHHKSVEGNRGKNFLVRWFYQYYWFFGYLCCGAEFTYMLLYVRQHLRPEASRKLHEVSLWLLLGCLPGCLAKQAVNVAQLSSSCRAIAQYDATIANKKAK